MKTLAGGRRGPLPTPLLALLGGKKPLGILAMAHT